MSHRRNHTIKGLNCHVCKGTDVSEKEAENVLLKYESATIKDSLKPEKLKQFRELDGILYYRSRITQDNPFKTEGLDGVPFLDMHEFVS